jgi:hypothetical protein
MEYARARQEQTRNRYGVEFRVYLRPLRMRSGATRCPLFSLPLSRWLCLSRWLAGLLRASSSVAGWYMNLYCFANHLDSCILFTMVTRPIYGLGNRLRSNVSMLRYA